MPAVNRHLVCFDLGGVLARIRRSWRSCADACGVRLGFEEGLDYDLSDFPLFDAFQLGALDTAAYLRDLASYLGVDEPAARQVHESILESPYPGTLELVRAIHGAGHDTGCLTNTNTLHWTLLDSNRFPAIRALGQKMTSHELRLLKPDPAIFRLFEKEAALPPERLVYFDDHQINVDAARAHGWKAHLVDYRNDPAAEIRQALERLEILP